MVGGGREGEREREGIVLGIAVVTGIMTLCSLMRVLYTFIVITIIIIVVIIIIITMANDTSSLLVSRCHGL